MWLAVWPVQQRCATIETTDALQAALASYPDAKVATRDDWVETRAKGVNQLLNLLYVLLGSR